MVSPFFTTNSPCWHSCGSSLSYPSPGPSEAWPPPPAPAKPRRQRTNKPKPCDGRTKKPHCLLCARDAMPPHQPPAVPPDPMAPTNRRPRVMDTSMHFCPHNGCDSWGWLGLGTLHAKGHPSGGPWRQFPWTSGGGYFLETYGTLFHGKQASVELMVRVLACLAEGLGIRASARVFEVAPPYRAALAGRSGRAAAGLFA